MEKTVAKMEDIILLKKQDRSDFSCYLKSSSLSFQLVNGRVAAYESKASEPLFVFGAPVMMDADGATSTAVRLSFDSGTGKVTVHADKKWLNEEERSYPVRIDPDMSLMSPDDIHFAAVASAPAYRDKVLGDSVMMAGYSDDYGNCRLFIELSPRLGRSH